MGYKAGVDRKQQVLFPETLDEYVSADNPVRVIDAFVDDLDLVKLGFERAVPASQGAPGYDPRDLLKLYIYGYLNRTRSSRRLEGETHRNLDVIWLMRKLPEAGFEPAWGGVCPGGTQDGRNARPAARVSGYSVVFGARRALYAL